MDLPKHQRADDHRVRRFPAVWGRTRLPKTPFTPHKVPAAFFFFAFCFQIAMTQEAPARIEEPSSGKFNSLQKSVLVPGWGQFAERKYLDGLVFLAAETFLVIDIMSNNRRGNTNYSLYRQADNTEDAIKYRGLTEKYDKKRNVGMLIAAGVWAVNLLDISMIVRHKSKKGERLDLRMDKHDKGQFTLSLSLSY